MPTRLYPQGRRESVNVLRHRLFVVTAVRFGRIPEAAQVGCDHRVRLGKLGDEGPPHVAGLSVTVQEQHRIAFAGDEIAKSGPVDLREAACDRDRLLCVHGSDDRRGSDNACQNADELLQGAHLGCPFVKRSDSSLPPESHSAHVLPSLQRLMGLDVTPVGCFSSPEAQRNSGLQPPQKRTRIAQTVGTVPPSITYSVPVIEAARGDTRNMTRSATSFGFEGLPSGMPPRPSMMICLPPS